MNKKFPLAKLYHPLHVKVVLDGQSKQGNVVKVVTL
jgi:hypothetical protein